MSSTLCLLLTVSSNVLYIISLLLMSLIEALMALARFLLSNSTLPSRVRDSALVWFLVSSPMHCVCMSMKISDLLCLVVVVVMLRVAAVAWCGVISPRSASNSSSRSFLMLARVVMLVVWFGSRNQIGVEVFVQVWWLLLEPSDS